jgi:hypothetical protein
MIFLLNELITHYLRNKINISFAGKFERIEIKNEIRIDNGNICVTIVGGETNHGFTRIFRRQKRDGITTRNGRKRKCRKEGF